ncbi:complex I intermediate-associated protein CIA30 [Suillus discolor]|uniref:Complex I intermediate-associated protein CIA30 n=1 Tax=Suillus discolor TaxID=1912936 RepID=A0A9P7JVL7_9AGAM|nr:complex I intermediate-associated protein CIA30 [Suillus discolor]KAG2110927.1 complex I intermediate-associated protein CIA30 [Suillus discolor]
MALSNWAAYLNRSTKLLRDSSIKILRMEGADGPSRAPLTLFRLNSKQDIEQFATGCDADIGGTSTAHLELDESTKRNKGSGTTATGRFWGEMRLDVRPELQGRIRGGYAGFRSKPRPTLFGEMVDDVSNHQFLALRLRLGGDPRLRNSYFVNLQTDGPITTDLWQHRLYFQRNDGDWEDVFIPFENFILTNTGELVQHQITMMRERIRTVGISLLGGNSGVPGSYDLGIDSIRAVNEEDVTRPPSIEKYPSRGI